MMRVPIRSVLVITGTVFTLASLAAEPLSEKAVKELSGFGTKAFGIKWTGRLVGANERDVIAVSDGITTLTLRKGSRTYIIHNNKLTHAKDKLQFVGTDAELKRTGIRILKATGSDLRQIAEVKVLQQRTQAALVDPQSQQSKLQPVQRGKRSLMITRQIDGIPVLSSRMMLNLDRADQIAFMELSWPDLSPEVIDMAKRLRKAVSDRFEAPPMEGATVESIQASILHSPAVGFYNDATAAIRVIYRPNSQNVGQKPVRYVDEDGKDVSQPRDVEAPREELVKRNPSYG